MLSYERDFLFSSPNIVKQMKSYLQERGLSKRESEVVILVIQGFTNKQVADQLCVAEKTIKFHLTNVYKRMKISRRSQIIWTLPMAQFIEQAKDTGPIMETRPTATHSSPSISSSYNIEVEEEPSIPTGTSTVTDRM